MKRSICLFLMTVLCLPSLACMTHRTGQGAAIGGAGGAAIGAAISKSTGGSGWAGALIGGIAGTVAGAIIGDAADKQEYGYRSAKKSDGKVAGFNQGYIGQTDDKKIQKETTNVGFMGRSPEPFDVRPVKLGRYVPCFPNKQTGACDDISRMIYENNGSSAELIFKSNKTGTIIIRGYPKKIGCSFTWSQKKGDMKIIITVQKLKDHLPLFEAGTQLSFLTSGRDVVLFENPNEFYHFWIFDN